MRGNGPHDRLAARADGIDFGMPLQKTVLIGGNECISFIGDQGGSSFAKGFGCVGARIQNRRSIAFMTWRSRQPGRLRQGSRPRTTGSLPASASRSYSAVAGIVPAHGPSASGRWMTHPCRSGIPPNRRYSPGNCAASCRLAPPRPGCRRAGRNGRCRWLDIPLRRSAAPPKPTAQSAPPYPAGQSRRSWSGVFSSMAHAHSQTARSGPA